MTAVPTTPISETRDLIDAFIKTEMQLRDELDTAQKALKLAEQAYVQCDAKLSDALCALFEEREHGRHLQKQLEGAVAP